VNQYNLKGGIIVLRKKMSILIAVALAFTLFAMPTQIVANNSVELIIMAELEYEQASNVPGIVPLSAPTIYISSSEDLELFLDGELGSNHDNFVLQGSFTISGNRLGRGLVDGQPFTGTFDGQGNTITGLTLRPRVSTTGNDLDDNNIGFIRIAGSGAEIRDVVFVNASGTEAYLDVAANNTGGWDAAQGRIGMVIGRVVPNASGFPVIVENVHLTGMTVMRMNRASTTTNKHIGGLVGGVDSGARLDIIDVSVANLDMHNQAGRTQSVGGLVGSSNGTLNITTYNQETNTVNIQIRGSGNTSNANMATSAGGVLGRMEAGNTSIADTTVRGTQIRAREFAGGIVGWTGTTGSLTIIDSNTGLADAAVGERLGTLTTHIANARAGGIVGRIGTTATLTNVRNRANIEHLVDNGNFIGGIVGVIEGPTTIDGAWNQGMVTHNHPAGISNVGGIVGRTANNVTITNAHNFANIINRGEGSNASAALGRSNSNRLGGIVGYIAWPTTVAASQRRAHLTNVSNSGTIGNDTNTANTVAGRGTATRQAGGIVGVIGNVASARTYITHATNMGNVRANRLAGGIIGWSNSPDVRIRYAMNHGRITIVEPGAAMNAGGIVGRTAQTGFLLERSGNTGVIRGLRGTTVTNTAVGGLVGRSVTAGSVIRESFNSGYVSQPGFNVGGLVGRNEGSMIIEDVYNIGAVSSVRTAENGRAGAGILGMNSSGPTTIRRAFVSGSWGGRASGSANDGGVAVAVSGNGTSRPVSGLSFSDVYVDTTTTPRTPQTGTTTTILNRARADVRRQQARTGINAVSTELLTSGLIPGFDGTSVIDGNPTWLLNFAGDLDGEYRRTYPFLAWQTGGVHPLPFFNSIRIGGSTNTHAFAMDAPMLGTNGTGAGSHAHFAGVSGAPGSPLGTGTRVFNPHHIATGAAANSNVAATAGHPAIPNAGNFTHAARNIANNTTNDVNQGASTTTSMGVINAQGVVGFSAMEVSDRIAITAVDEVTGETLGHAIFTHTNFTAAANIINAPGIFIAETAGMTGAPSANASALSVTAVGYAPVNGRSLTLAEIAAAEAGEEVTLEIPMTRVAMDIRVWVRSENPDPDAARGISVLGTAPWTGSYIPSVVVTDIRYAYTEGTGWEITTDGSSRPPLARNANAATISWFALNGVMVGDRIVVTMPGFVGTDFYFNSADLMLIGGNFELDIDITDLHVQNIQFRTWGGVNNDGVPINPINVLAEGANQRFDLMIADSEITPGAVNRATNVFTATLLTLNSTVWVESHNNSWVDSDPFVLGDLLEEFEDAPGFYPIDIILEPAIIQEVRVVGRTQLPDGTYLELPLPNANLYVNERPARLVGTSTMPGTFYVRVAAEQTIAATAPGFVGGKLILPEDHDENYVTMYLYRKVPMSGTIQGFVLATADNTYRTPTIYEGGGISNARVVIINEVTGEVVTTATADTTGFFRAGVIINVGEDEYGEEYSYEVGTLPTGRYIIMAEADWFISGVSPQSVVGLKADEGAIANIYLAPNDAQTIYSLIVFVKGTASTAISVTLNGDSIAASAANNRTFVGTSVDRANLLGYVWVTAAGYRPVRYNVAVAGFGAENFALINMNLVPIEVDDYSGIISGQVFLGANGVTTNPINNADVMVISAPGTATSTTTNVYGHFEVADLAEGYYTVVARHDLGNGYILIGTSVVNPARVEEGKVTTANVFLNPANYVVDDSFMLIANVVNAANGAQVPNASVWTVDGALSRATGQFWTGTLSDDEAVVFGAYAPDFFQNSVRLTEAHFSENGLIAFVEIPLSVVESNEGYGSIVGRVTAAETGSRTVAGLGGAIVTKVSADGSEAVAIADSNGFYHFVNVVPGTYTLIARAPYFHAATVSSPVVANETAHTNIELSASDINLGYILIVSVTPASAVVNSEVTHGTTEFTNAENVWIAESERAFTGSVMVNSSGYLNRSVAVPAADAERAQRLNVVLREAATGPLVIVGTVRLAHKLRVSSGGSGVRPDVDYGIRVTVYANAAAFNARTPLEAAVYTNNDGRFELPIRDEINEETIFYIRMARRYDNGGTLRYELYRDLQVRLTLPAYAAGEITLSSYEAQPQHGQPNTDVFWLFPGAFGDANAIGIFDYIMIRGAATNFAVTGGMAMAMDINERDGIDGADLAAVRASIGPMERLEITIY